LMICCVSCDFVLVSSCQVFVFLDLRLSLVDVQIKMTDFKVLVNFGCRVQPAWLFCHFD
jgi:hypothetical protein